MTGPQFALRSVFISHEMREGERERKTGGGVWEGESAPSAWAAGSARLATSTLTRAPSPGSRRMLSKRGQSGPASQTGR